MTFNIQNFKKMEKRGHIKTHFAYVEEKSICMQLILIILIIYLCQALSLVSVHHLK